MKQQGGCIVTLAVQLMVITISRNARIVIASASIRLLDCNSLVLKHSALGLSQPTTADNVRNNTGIHDYHNYCSGTMRPVELQAVMLKRLQY